MSDHPAQHPYDPNRFPHFESPWMSPRLYDVMYAASGKTRAKNHLIMRAYGSGGNTAFRLEYRHPLPMI